MSRRGDELTAGPPQPRPIIAALTSAASPARLGPTDNFPSPGTSVQSDGGSLGLPTPPEPLGPSNPGPGSAPTVPGDPLGLLNLTEPWPAAAQAEPRLSRGGMVEQSSEHVYTIQDIILYTGICVSVILYVVFLYCLITKVRKWKGFRVGDSKADMAELKERQELEALQKEMRKHHKDILVKADNVHVEHTKVLGAGQFSAVFLGHMTTMSKDPTEPKAVYKKREHKSAVKQVNQQTPANHAALLREGRELSELAHPNIVALKGLCLESPFGPMIIMEFLDGGSLKTLLDDVRAGFLPAFDYHDARRVLADVAGAVAYLHSKEHVHRDLAARNVLLTDRRLKTAAVKLADFGLAQDKAYYQMNNPYRMIPVAGMTPEVFLYQLFCAGSDVWSFGVMVWEVLTVGGLPMEGLSMDDIQRRVTSPKPQHRFLPTPPRTPRPLAAMMQSCWGLAYGTRPDMAKLQAQLKALKLPATPVPVPSLPLVVPSLHPSCAEDSPVPTDPDHHKASVDSLRSGAAKLAPAYPKSRESRDRTLSSDQSVPDLSRTDARAVPLAFHGRARQTSEGYEAPLNASRSSSVATSGFPQPPPSLSSEEYFAAGQVMGVAPLAASTPHGSQSRWRPPSEASSSAAAPTPHYYNNAAFSFKEGASSDSIDVEALDEASQSSGPPPLPARRGRGKRGTSSHAEPSGQSASGRSPSGLSGPSPPGESPVGPVRPTSSSSSGVSSLLSYMRWRDDVKESSGAYI